jgi:hypothetical protein
MSPTAKKRRSSSKRSRARAPKPKMRAAAAAKTFEGFASDTVREFAAKQGKALSSYGELLTGFGSGRTKAPAVSEEMLKLAIEQSTGYARDVVKFGGAYFRLLVSLADFVAPKEGPRATAANATPRDSFRGRWANFASKRQRPDKPQRRSSCRKL